MKRYSVFDVTGKIAETDNFLIAIEQCYNKIDQFSDNAELITCESKGAIFEIRITEGVIKYPSIYFKIK